MYLYVKEMQNTDELITKEKVPNFINKVIIKLKTIFNIITIKQIDKAHYILIIPKANDKKIIKIKEKYKKYKIVFSKKLSKYQELIEREKIIKYFIEDIMNFIINKTKDDSIKLELQSVYILVNEYNSENLEIIQNIMQKVKTVNIVTKELNKYIALEEKMSNEKGIYMSVTNNKRKSLKNAKIIINFDFKNEEIAQYSINRNCIFINCANEKINCVKYFDGIIINNISIDFEEPEEIKKYNIYNEFDKIKIYEDFIFFNIMGEPNFKYLGSNCERLRIAKPICSEIDRKNIKIEDLMGNNGKINQKELVKMKKLLDKC